MAGIYLHIPYCKKLCHYCDFYRVICPEDRTAFIGAICREMELRKEYLQGENISTIYFGGGTPSVLPAGELETILGSLWSIFSVDTDAEITIEMNPDDVTPEYLKSLISNKFNRISLGIQSWRNQDLKMLNRRHNSEQAETALRNVFSAGFENVTIDLIYGIPGLTSEAWADNLNKSLSFDIKHLSAYHLTIEEGTVFGKMKREGLLTEIDEEESAGQFNSLIEKTEKAGFVHYEISNFAKEGYFSRHNTNYWRQVNYIGLGPGAHSFNNWSRQWNVNDVRKYISSVKSGKPFFEKEELGVKTRFNEYIMTSLRTMWGIDLDFVERSFEKEGYDYIMNLAGKLKAYGLMKQEKNNLILTNQGKMISDNIISEFMMAEKE